MDHTKPRRRRTVHPKMTTRQLVGLVLVLACIAAMSLWVSSVASTSTHASNKATAASNEVAAEVQARALAQRDNLRQQCRKNSQQRTAPDVNLDWEYYISETQLNSRSISPAKIKSLLNALSPAERQFMLILFSSSKPSQAILRKRAEADFNAAFTKARTIDYRDARLVKEATPRSWVLKAHFSCDVAYP